MINPPDYRSHRWFGGLLSMAFSWSLQYRVEEDEGEPDMIGFVLPKCDIGGSRDNESPFADLNKKIEKQPHAK